MKKRKKKSNKQSRREIIADVKRREVEWRKERRKERWRICKSHIMLWGTFISFFLLLIFVMLSDIRNTFSNIILGLIAINGGIYLFMYILFKAARNLIIRIPLKNGESTGNTQWLLDSSETLVEPEYLSRCDDKQIVIDNVTIPGRLLLHKKETIPYSQAELTIRYYMGRGSLGVVTSIIISNSNSPSLLSGVSLMPGDIDEARRFARFIQLYMEKEELPDIPEFEKYRNEVNV